MIRRFNDVGSLFGADPQPQPQPKPVPQASPQKQADETADEARRKQRAALLEGGPNRSGLLTSGSTTPSSQIQTSRPKLLSGG